MATETPLMGEEGSLDPWISPSIRLAKGGRSWVFFLIHLSCRTHQGSMPVIHQKYRPTSEIYRCHLKMENLVSSETRESVKFQPRNTRLFWEELQQHPFSVGTLSTWI